MAPVRPGVGRLGVHSALSLPLLLPDRGRRRHQRLPHGKDVFDDQVPVGELFAAPAAVAVHNAHVLLQGPGAHGPTADSTVGPDRSSIRPSGYPRSERRHVRRGLRAAAGHQPDRAHQAGRRRERSRRRGGSPRPGATQVGDLMLITAVGAVEGSTVKRARSTRRVLTRSSRPFPPRNGALLGWACLWIGPAFGERSEEQTPRGHQRSTRGGPRAAHRSAGRTRDRHHRGRCA